MTDDPSGRFLFSQEGLGMQREVFHIGNKIGIHARPAALLVQTAARFQSKIMLRAGDKTADARSILMVMGLQAKQGTDLVVVADGPDEQEALAALRQFAAEHLDE